MRARASCLALIIGRVSDTGKVRHHDALAWQVAILLLVGRTVAEDSTNAYNRPIMKLDPRYAQHAGNVTVQRLAAALEKRGDVRLAYLFGSLARGTASPDSDVDVALSLGRPMTTAEKIDLIGSIGALLGRPVDLIDMEMASGAILGTVFQEGIRFIDDVKVRERAIANRANWQTDVAPYVERLRAERRAAWLGRE